MAPLVRCTDGVCTPVVGGCVRATGGGWPCARSLARPESFLWGLLFIDLYGDKKNKDLSTAMDKARVVLAVLGVKHGRGMWVHTVMVIDT